MAKVPESKPQKRKAYVDTMQAQPYEAWWSCDKDLAGNNMVQLIQTIEENQKERKWMDLRHGYMYQNRNSYDPLGGYLNHARALPDRYNVTYNVVKSAIDTLTSRIAQSRPRPRILTEKGDYAQQLRAKQLTKYLDGVLASAQTYRQGSQAFKDGSIFGTGCIKVIPNAEKGCVETERVLITEIFVDEMEAAYGTPQSIYQTKLVSRDSLLEMFPDKDLIIAQAHSESNNTQRNETIDMIRVYEGWHLPKHDGKGGRHVIALSNGQLATEDWTYNCFPFAFFRYNTNIASFYGQGISEELFGTQLEINKLLRDIQRAQNLIAVPRVLMEYNSKVIASHLNNEIGSAIKYRGTKPSFINPTAMNNEIYNHVKWLIGSAYEKVGISQLSASSKKPSGLDSGVALREFKDTETERFASTVKAYEEFFEDIAKLIVTFSRKLYKNNKDLKITAESKKFIESIQWSDVDLEDDKFVLRVYSSSIFPTSPAAKLQKVEEYIRAGWMDRETAIRLLDFPDVESWETLETADRDLTEKIISEILAKGKYTAPEPEMLLEQDINIARKAYLEGRTMGAKEENLELLLRWIEAAASMLPPPAPALPAPVQPELAQPMAEPMPLPEAGLLPQV